MEYRPIIVVILISSLRWHANLKMKVLHKLLSLVKHLATKIQYLVPMIWYLVPKIFIKIQGTEMWTDLGNLHRWYCIYLSPRSWVSNHLFDQKLIIHWEKTSLNSASTYDAYSGKPFSFEIWSTFPLTIGH